MQFVANTLAFGQACGWQTYGWAMILFLGANCSVVEHLLMGNSLDLDDDDYDDARLIAELLFMFRWERLLWLYYTAWCLHDLILMMLERV